MRILFTSFTYFPHTSGVAIAVQTLAEGLARRGHEVSVVTRLNIDTKSKEVHNGVHICRINFGQNLFKKNIGDCKGYIDFVKQYPKDILVLECIQCHSTDILLPYLKDMNCKIVLHSHGGPGIHFKPFGWEGDLLHTIGHIHNYFRWKKYYGFTLPSVAKYIDLALCLSLCASDLAFMNAHMRRVEILENAASDIFFDKDFGDLNTHDVLDIKNPEYILCIANYIPNKSQDDILEAFSKIRNNRCSLVFIGSKENSYYRKLTKKAKKIMEETGKEIVLLTGVDRTLFPAIIHNSKLFVMASKHEEYPVSLVEAMACGTPFLSTDAGCSRILPGGVTVSDRRDLSVFMDMLESHPIMRKTLAKRGENYACEINTVERYVHIFETYVGNVMNIEVDS